MERLVDLPKTAVLVGASTGLRVGEILGLKWEDVDFERLELRIIRDVVKQRIERCKTEASRKPVPIGAEVAEILGHGETAVLTTNRRIGYLPVQPRRANNLTGRAPFIGST